MEGKHRLACFGLPFQRPRRSALSSLSRRQLGVGCLWALLLWGYPDARKLPKLTTEPGAPGPDPAPRFRCRGEAVSGAFKGFWTLGLWDLRIFWPGFGPWSDDADGVSSASGESSGEGDELGIARGWCSQFCLNTPQVDLDPWVVLPEKEPGLKSTLAPW